MPTRWLIPLEGDLMDLEEFPRWNPDGEVFGVRENGEFYLAGPAFESLSEPAAVLEKAQEILEEYAAVVSLLWSGLRAPTVSRVIREDDHSKRRAYVFATASIVARAKLSAIASTGSCDLPRTQTQAQELLANAKAHTHLYTALLLWHVPARSWPRLYRIMEELEQHYGQPLHARGLCAAAERERFRRTANTAEVAGDDARHASGKFRPLPNPMTLREAESFIGQLLHDALRRPSWLGERSKHGSLKICEHKGEMRERLRGCGVEAFAAFA